MKSAYTAEYGKGKGRRAVHGALLRRRVVVTGIGAVSPNGVGRETFWEATRKGVSGVRRISRFDPSGYAVQVAGEVDFDESAYIQPKERQHVSRAVPIGV